MDLGHHPSRKMSLDPASYGAEIAARIGEDCFDDLDAPVGRVGGLNVPMPYSRVLELECIPNENNVVDAVRKLG